MDIHKLIVGWQWFRDFFNITIFKYLVTWFAILPIFAKISEKLPKEIIIPVSKKINYIIVLELPFKWQILWISSLSFVIAYILYQILVPKYITLYFNFKYYKEYEHSPRWLVYEVQKLIKSKTDLSKFIERMEEKKYIVRNYCQSSDNNQIHVKELQTELYFDYNQNKYIFALPILNEHNTEEDNIKTTIAIREIFWEIFGRFSSSKIIVRGIIMFLLLVSLITFTIPFLQSICSGFQYLFKQ